MTLHFERIKRSLLEQSHIVRLNNTRQIVGVLRDHLNNPCPSTLWCRLREGWESDQWSPETSGKQSQKSRPSRGDSENSVGESHTEYPDSSLNEESSVELPTV